MAMETSVKVLVVDDEPGIRESLADFLDDYEFDVFSAESAEQALEIVESETLDLAIVDLRLPGISGDTMILKSHSLRPEMKFLIHTGSVDYRLPNELKAIGMGSENLFLKPIPDLTVIIDAINKILGT
jgi:DNA-binding NtrC family response regulator